MVYSHYHRHHCFHIAVVAWFVVVVVVVVAASLLNSIDDDTRAGLVGMTPIGDSNRTKEQERHYTGWYKLQTQQLIARDDNDDS